MTTQQSHSQHPPSMPHLLDASSVQGLVLVHSITTMLCFVARKINMPKWDNNKPACSSPSYSQGKTGELRVQSQPRQLNEMLSQNKMGTEDTAQLQSNCLQYVREGSTPAMQEMKKNHHLHPKVATIRASGTPFHRACRTHPRKRLRGYPGSLIPVPRDFRKSLPGRQADRALSPGSFSCEPAGSTLLWAGLAGSFYPLRVW